GGQSDANLPYATACCQLINICRRSSRMGAPESGRSRPRRLEVELPDTFSRRRDLTGKIPGIESRLLRVSRRCKPGIEGVARGHDATRPGVSDRAVRAQAGRETMLAHAPTQSHTRQRDRSGAVHRTADIQRAALWIAPRRHA